MNSKRRKSLRSGYRAETIASLLLTIKGYRLLAHRYKTPVGEIDLIAKKGKRIIFIEVKMRSDHEKALWSVSPKQQRRIRRAAKYWLAGARNNTAKLQVIEYGFDVITVSPFMLPVHHKDAFSHQMF